MFYVHKSIEITIRFLRPFLYLKNRRHYIVVFWTIKSKRFWSNLFVFHHCHQTWVREMDFDLVWMKQHPSENLSNKTGLDRLQLLGANQIMRDTFLWFSNPRNLKFWLYFLQPEKKSHFIFFHLKESDSGKKHKT